VSTASVAAVPPAAQLRARIRRLRRTHSDRSIGDLLTNIYMAALFVALYGYGFAVTLRQHVHPRGSAAPADTGERQWLALGLLVVLAALTWRALRAVGPLIATPAVQAWCLTSPVPRGEWLTPPLAYLLCGAGLAGAAVAAVVAWAAYAPIGWGVLTGVGLGAAMAAAAVMAQPSGTVHARERAGVTAAIGAGVAAMLAALLTQTRAAVPPIPLWIVAALAGIAAVACGWIALRTLPRLDRAVLAGGAPLAGAAVSAVVMLDPSLFFGVAQERRWRQAGRVRSRHWLAGGRAGVLLQADLRRQLRRRAELATWAGLVLLPYAAQAFAPAATGVVRVIAGYVATERLTAGLRTVSRSPALRRTLGGSDRALRYVHLVVPALGLALWWTATHWAGASGRTDAGVGLLLAAGLVLAAARTATRKPMSYDGALVDTPFGTIPADLVRQVFRGPDLVALLVLVQLLSM
jgi:hypothetical protein